MATDARKSPIGPAVVHHWRQDIPLHFTGYRLTDAAREMFAAQEAPATREEPFPRPQRKDGGEPCAECHLKPGETCDICGAQEKM
jgi:hypothetical protein